MNNFIKCIKKEFEEIESNRFPSPFEPAIPKKGGAFSRAN